MKRIVYLSLLTYSFISSTTITLPEGFCVAQDIAQKKGCAARQVEVTTQAPVFLFLVHGTFSSADSFLDNLVFADTVLPEGLLDNPVYTGQVPTRISFTWSGDNNDTARFEGGKKFAQGINDILKQCTENKITPAFVVIAHSHGGNVTAVASNFVNQPIDLALFLGTPVLKADQKKKYGSDLDYYLPKSIKNLFVFYSMQDMIQTTGAFSSDFKRRFGPITGINVYNVRLLLNGQEPDHGALYTQLIDDHIFELCQKIKKNFIKNRNLVANIAPQNPSVDKLIAIKVYDPTSPNPLTGGSTDMLWQNWQDFTYTAGEPDEAQLSEQARMTFNNFYHVDFTDTLPLVDRTLRSAQVEFCNRAVGKMGSLLVLMPNEKKDAIATTCCPFDSFRTKHPNATQALQCSKRSLPTPRILTPEENKKFCLNVAGVPGSLLSFLPESEQQDLNKRCCSSEFKQKHPQGAQALKCP